MNHCCPIPVSDRSHALGAGRTLPDPGVALAPEPAAALRAALLGGETHYTPRPGLPELQEAIGRQLAAAGAPPGGTVVITGGRQEALFVALAGARAEASDAPGSVALSPAILGDPGVLAACALLDLFPVDDANGDGVVARVVTPEEAGGTAPVEIVDCGDRLLPADGRAPFLAGVGEEAVLLGSLDGLPELAPFRVGFFRVPPRLLGRLRSLKQAVSICTAAPSQRTAALLLGAGSAKTPPRPTLAKPGRDDSRYSLMELAARLEGVVSLGRGDPDADAPESVAGGRLRPDRRNGTAGSPRPALAPRTDRRAEEARTGIRWDPDTETLVTGGAQEGITLAMLALVGEREDVLLADPRYTSYVQAIGSAAGTAR